MKQEKHQGKDRLTAHRSAAPGDEPVENRFQPPAETDVVINNPIPFPAESEKESDADEKPAQKNRKSDPEPGPGKKIIHGDLSLQAINLCKKRPNLSI